MNKHLTTYQNACYSNFIAHREDWYKMFLATKGQCHLFFEKRVFKKLTK
jgi:hypothetical protein